MTKSIDTIRTQVIWYFKWIETIMFLWELDSCQTKNYWLWFLSWKFNFEFGRLALVSFVETHKLLIKTCMRRLINFQICVIKQEFVDFWSTITKTPQSDFLILKLIGIWAESIWNKLVWFIKFVFSEWLPIKKSHSSDTVNSSTNVQTLTLQTTIRKMDYLFCFCELLSSRSHMHFVRCLVQICLCSRT